MAIMSDPMSGNSASKQLPSPMAGNYSVCFVAEPAKDVEILRRFSDPRSASAVRNSSAIPTTEPLHILSTSDPKAVVDRLDVVIDGDFGRISWQPGRAILQGKTVDSLLPAI